MTDLFPIPETLSPRLTWIAEHGILTHHCPSKDVFPWIAIIPFDEDKAAGRDIYECMAHNCRLYDESGSIGYGATEADAILDLAVNLKLPLWNEEREIERLK